VRSVAPAEAEPLIASGRVRVLDVRNPDEWAGLGYIPGAILLPLDLVASAAATLPRDGTPLLVCCEHGIRSAMAARLLAQAGHAEVLNLSGGMSCWQGPRDRTARDPDSQLGPSAWLLSNADLIPQEREVLDLACGSGRHALLLGSAGFSVHAVDRDAAHIESLSRAAAALGLPVRAEVLDLESGKADLGESRYGAIVVIHYLHRPLFPAIARALQPGGILIYETFTSAQASRGKPTSPDYLLKPGELPRLAHSLEILRTREGDYEDRMVSAIAARRPA
jgi:rhodanese-related sulfurtransferase